MINWKSLGKAKIAKASGEGGKVKTGYKYYALEYYNPIELGENVKIETARFIGSGAEKLELSNLTPTGELIEALANGQIRRERNGKEQVINLCQNPNSPDREVGYDFTLSFDNSISTLMTFAAPEQKADLNEWLKNAETHAFSELEKIITYRTGKAGVNEHKAAGLVVCGIRHFDTRGVIDKTKGNSLSNDELTEAKENVLKEAGLKDLTDNEKKAFFESGSPTFHTHYLITNTCYTGKPPNPWKTFEGISLTRNKAFLAACIENDLAHKIQEEWGFEPKSILNKNKTMLASVGVELNLTPEQNAFLSKRTKVAEQLAFSAFSKEHLGVEKEELEKQWNKIDPSELSERITKYCDLTKARKDHDKQTAELFKQWEIEGAKVGLTEEIIAKKVKEKILNRKTTAQTEKEIQDKIAEQVVKISIQKSAFTREELFVAVVKESGGQYTSIDLLKGVDLALSNKEEYTQLLTKKTPYTPSTTRFQSKAMSLMELEIMAITKNGRGNHLDQTGGEVDKANKYVKRVVKEQKEKGINLATEQVIALQSLITSSDQVRILIGDAGVGKSTSLKFIADYFRENGKEVYGTAIANKVISAMASDGITSSPDGTPRQYTMAALLYGDKPAIDKIPNGSVIFVDEAGMVSSKAGYDLLTKAKSKNLTVILTGDTKQLQPVEAGNLLHLASAATTHLRLKEVKRQKHDWMRKASEDFAEGRPEGYFAYRNKGFVEVGEEKECLKNIVKDYMEAKGDKIIIAMKKDECRKINNEIQKQKWQVEGSQQPAIEVDGEEGFKTAIKENERIILRFNDKNLKIANNDLATVESIKDGKITIRIDGKKTDTVIDLSDLNEDKPVLLGYASNTHKLQGASIDNVFLYATDQNTLNNASMYVGCTRHKQQLKIYTTDEVDNLMPQLIAKKSLNKTIIDYEVTEASEEVLKKIDELKGVVEPVELKTNVENNTEEITKITKNLQQKVNAVSNEIGKIIEEINEALDEVEGENNDSRMTEEEMRTLLANPIKREAARELLKKKINDREDRELLIDLKAAELLLGSKEINENKVNRLLLKLENKVKKKIRSRKIKLSKLPKNVLTELKKTGKQTHKHNKAVEKAKNKKQFRSGYEKKPLVSSTNASSQTGNYATDIQKADFKNLKQNLSQKLRERQELREAEETKRRGFRF